MSSHGKLPLVKVSVIVPTYNRAAYIRQALDSIFEQTLAPWEVIVIDDGSTDETHEIVQGFSQSVRFYQQTHKGVAAARNLGLNKATGDLIAWLDSDDLWEPNFLATAVSTLAQDKTLDGVYTGITLVDDENRPLNTSTRVEPPDQLYNTLIQGSFLATPSIVVRKRCYDMVGGFDTQLRIAEDYDMWLRLARQFCIAGIPVPLVRIRIHATNTMSDIDTLCKSNLKVTQKHFGELGRNDEAIPNISRRAYGYAFRFIALKYIEVGNATEGWAYLEKAILLHPALLRQLDTFYELACGNQPRGYRGTAVALDIKTNGEDILARLETFFANAPLAIKNLRGLTFGNAHLALAMLSDQVGDWYLARRYMRHAVAANPNLLANKSNLRRLIKLHLGHRVKDATKAMAKY